MEKRKVVVEFNVVGNNDGKRYPGNVISAAEYGEEIFDSFYVEGAPNIEDGIIGEHNNASAGSVPVTYSRIFLVTAESDCDILAQLESETDCHKKAVDITDEFDYWPGADSFIHWFICECLGKMKDAEITDKMIARPRLLTMQMNGEPINPVHALNRMKEQFDAMVLKKAQTLLEEERDLLLNPLRDKIDALTHEVAGVVDVRLKAIKSAIDSKIVGGGNAPAEAQAIHVANVDEATIKPAFVMTDLENCGSPHTCVYTAADLVAGEQNEPCLACMLIDIMGEDRREEAVGLASRVAKKLADGRG